jgi:hypothetical protein
MTRPIAERIDDAITKAIGREARGFRALYLTEDDHRTLKNELGFRLFADVTCYRNIPIRRGTTSMLYDRSGTGTHVPKR